MWAMTFKKKIKGSNLADGMGWGRDQKSRNR